MQYFSHSEIPYIAVRRIFVFNRSTMNEHQEKIKNLVLKEYVEPKNLIIKELRKKNKTIEDELKELQEKYSVVVAEKWKLQAECNVNKTLQQTHEEVIGKNKNLVDHYYELEQKYTASEKSKEDLVEEYKKLEQKYTASEKSKEGLVEEYKKLQRVNTEMYEKLADSSSSIIDLSIDNNDLSMSYNESEYGSVPTKKRRTPTINEKSWKKFLEDAQNGDEASCLKILRTFKKIVEAEGVNNVPLVVAETYQKCLEVLPKTTPLSEIRLNVSRLSTPSVLSPIKQNLFSQN